MSDLESDQSPGNRDRRWVWFFLFLSVQAIPVLYWIASLPADPKNSLILGYSLPRLGMMLVVLLLGLFFLAAAIIAGMKENRLQSVFQERWHEGRIFFWLEGLAILCAVLAWGYLVYLRSGVNGGTDPLYIRFQPFLVWLIALGGESAVWLWIQCYGWHPDRLVRFRMVFFSSAATAGILLIFGLIIGVTGWGVTPDIFFWGNPGVPLLAWQVWLSAAAGLVLLTVLVSFPVLRVYQRRMDWIICGGLFILAVILWLAQPIPSSFFFPTPRAPEFKYFPYSDAGFYDYAAQTLLVGEGFLNGQIVTRPLYIFLLAIWHGMEGQDYGEIIVLQTLALAAFPAALYWLGRSMRSREAGLTAGLLAIFRELNSIAATPLTEVSHSKMLMTDSLTGLGLCLMCLAVFRWLKKPGPRPVRAVLIGGGMGLLLLLRSQTSFIIPVILVFLLLQRKTGWKGALKESVYFLAGLILAASPWIIRNGLRTGDFALDQPSQAVLVAQRYASSVDEALNTRLEASSGQVGAHILEYTFSHPLDVARFIGAHFINNAFATLEVLPLHVSFVDYHDNFRVSSLFWLEGISTIRGIQWVYLILNLLLLSIGIGSSFAKWRWSGLLPLAFHAAYSLSTAFGRISGWRFIQPVDWVGYFYFCLGFAECIVWFFAASNLSLRPREKNTRELPPARTSSTWITVSAAAVLLAGLALPASEWLIPRRYSLQVEQEAIKTTGQVEQLETVLGTPKEFLQQPGAVRMIGRALYPRWYKADDGEPGNGWAAYKPQKDAHLGFMMVGPYREQQMILSVEQPPEDFTHASDVIVYGCQKSDFIDVRLVVGYNQPDIFNYASQNLTRRCD